MKSPDALNDIVDTLRSPGWALIEARLQQMRTQFAEAGLGSKSWEEFVKVQGQIQGVQRAMEIPEILRRELAKK